VFYKQTQQCVIVGDVIFEGSVGLTDSLKGISEQFIQLIETQILTLPDNTKN
jgi:hydroxyacylglutathione hydrolase